MPWATRGRRRYFYRSKRLPDGRIAKEYLGRGQRAEQAAKQDAETHARDEAERGERSRVEAVLEPLDALAYELESSLELLTMATFLAGGLHQHKGQWRKRRRKTDIPC